jgi:hypothetical protein
MKMRSTRESTRLLSPQLITGFIWQSIENFAQNLEHHPDYTNRRRAAALGMFATGFTWKSIENFAHNLELNLDYT